MEEINDDVKKMLQQKYADQLNQINVGQAFANLGDVIGGQKVGSTSPFFAEQRKIAEGQTLGEYEKEQERLYRQQQAKENLNMKLLQMAQQKELSQQNLDVKKLLAQSNLDAKKQKAEELNQFQSKQVGLVKMGHEANDQYNEAIKAGYDPTSYNNKLDFIEGAPQFVKSDLGKKARAAENNWVEAYLRDASGAAIAVSERAAYANDFFARPGDTPEIVANKEKLRAIKEENAKAAMGSKGEAVLGKQIPKVGQQQKVETKRLYSPSTKKTKIIYSDGTSEVIDGQ